MVIAQVALSLVLLSGAGLLIRSFTRLQNIDPGFRAENLLTARVQLPSARYHDPRRSAAFYTDTLARVVALPGVESAAAVSFLPLAGLGIATRFYRADGPVPTAGEAPSTDVRPVTAEFFRTRGVPALAGRECGELDEPVIEGAADHSLASWADSSGGPDERGHPTFQQDRNSESVR
jgi:hypothetical protein